MHYVTVDKTKPGRPEQTVICTKSVQNKVRKPHENDDCDH